MKNETFVLTPETQSKPLRVVGVDVTVLASSDQTGAYEITLQEGPAGTGPGRHTHPWDESFFVLRGTVEIDCDGKVTNAKAGTLVHFPKGAAHGYRFGAEGGAMLEISGPGGVATKMFALIANAMTPQGPDMAKLGAACEATGAQFVQA